jgi:hypothetical protein
MTDTFCLLEECTVAQTGKCLLNNPPETCPNYSRSGNVVDEGESELTPGDPVLTAPVQVSRFPPSAALGIEDVRVMMGRRYGRVIGVLGVPDSGKTACLVSLYLLLAHGRLRGFSFADSKSLMAFEDLARGARSWSQGGPPEEMTVHTDLGDGRVAGFLHLKLRRNVDGNCFDLFIPDLPGEWSTGLIDTNRIDRLQFLRGVHAIWLMVDGRSLVAPAQRLNAIHRIRRLIGRIADLCATTIPPLFLVVTRLDLGQPGEQTLDEIRLIAKQKGVDLAIHIIASFSKNRKVQAGAGISDLIEATVVRPGSVVPFWPDAPGAGSDSRCSLRIYSGS